MAHNRKKISKRVEFAKPKTRAGKPPPKLANATDTNFRAKGIVVKQQYTTSAFRSLSNQIESNIKLLTSYSANQRQESLSALLNIGVTETLPLAKLLPAALPLIVDPSRSVREQLLKLLKRLSSSALLGYEQQTVSHLQIGLTHISPDICSTSLMFLDWAMTSFGSDLLSCKGGWLNLLRTLIFLLGWSDLARPSHDQRGNWNGNRPSFARLDRDDKILPDVLRAFAKFLQLGLAEPGEDILSSTTERLGFKAHTKPHMLQHDAKGFMQLALFNVKSDRAQEMYASPNDRRGLVRSYFAQQIDKGVCLIQARGGESGRIAASIGKVLRKYVNEADE